MKRDVNSPQHIQDLEASIKNHFEKPQLYLRSKLKLGDMATIVGTNRTYLSRYLNEVKGMTFYEYINSLRLDYAMRLIERANSDLNVVATHAGFNSYSTFRRVFTSRHGYPPSEYRMRRNDDK